MPASDLTALLIAASAVSLLLWSVHRIDYRVDDAHVRVVLGGLTLRKIALADIERIDASAPVWNEHWCNTFFPRGRIVCLRRRSGLVRDFIITPADRAQFLGILRARCPLGVPIS